MNFESYKDCPSILEYSTKPNFDKIRLGGESHYYGIELEVESESSDSLEDWRKTAVYMMPQGIFKRDGSLKSPACELVTAPYNYLAHEKLGNWRGILKSGLERGLTSHDNSRCGLHVHVSRRGGKLGSLWADYMGSLVGSYADNLTELSRRGSGELDHYACFIRSASESGISGWRGRGRFLALNPSNTHTLELRFFRGTLKLSSFLASLEIVRGLDLYALSLAQLHEAQKLIGLWVPNWAGFMAFCSGAGLNRAVGYSQAKLAGQVSESEQVHEDSPIFPATSANCDVVPLEVWELSEFWNMFNTSQRAGSRSLCFRNYLCGCDVTALSLGRLAALLLNAYSGVNPDFRASLWNCSTDQINAAWRVMKSMQAGRSGEMSLGHCVGWLRDFAGCFGLDSSFVNCFTNL